MMISTLSPYSQYSYKSFSEYNSKLLDYLEKLSYYQQANTFLYINYFSPFVYKIFEENFEIKNEHFYNIIKKSRFIQNKIFEDNSFNILNCFQVEAIFLPKEKDILFSIKPSFLNFLKSHQIEVCEKLEFKNMDNLYIPYLYELFISEKLFNNKSSKVKGHIDFIEQYWNLFKDQREFLYQEKNFFKYQEKEFEEWLEKNKIYVSLENKNNHNFYLSLIVDLSFQDISREKIQIENKLISNNIDKSDLRFNYIDFINQFQKMKFNKKRFLIEFLTDNLKVNNFIVKVLLENNNLDDSVSKIKNIKNSENIINKFNKWVKFLDMGENHPRLNEIFFEYLSNNLLPIISIEEKIEKTRTYVKILDFIENKYKYTTNYHFCFGILEDCDFLELSFENLTEILKNKIKNKNLKENDLMVQPLDIFSYFYGFQIVELTTKQMLNEEGKINKNCVGGKIVSAKSRIFSIRWEEDEEECRHSIHFVKHQKWKIVESKGKKNKCKDNYNDEIKIALSSIEEKLLQELHKKDKKSIKDLELESFFFELED